MALELTEQGPSGLDMGARRPGQYLLLIPVLFALAAAPAVTAMSTTACLRSGGRRLRAAEHAAAAGVRLHGASPPQYLHRHSSAPLFVSSCAEAMERKVHPNGPEGIALS